jgi:hypothetical protein
VFASCCEASLNETITTYRADLMGRAVLKTSSLSKHF